MRAPAIVGAVLFTLGVALSVWAVVERLAGGRLSTAVLVLAGVYLIAGAMVAAGLAALAFTRRDWGWGAGLLVAWPVLVPLYLIRLRGSAEPQV